MRALLLYPLVLFAFVSFAQIKLPRLISDGMVLQRDAKVKLWGWASPNEKINLQFSGKEFSTQADTSGYWTIHLPKQKTGGPFEMIFKASNTITIKNILFGDVWLCSGQSNMELAMDRVQYKYTDVVAQANNDQIRQFLVPDKYDFEKTNPDVESGEWLSVSKQNIFKFSAVAYFFASELYAKYKVPIGLINSALGGSPAEAWISEDELKKFPEYYNEAQRFKDKNLINQIETADRKTTGDWYSQLNKTDEGITQHWSSPGINDNDWQIMNVPGYWADGPLGKINGAVWFRKEIEINTSLANKSAQLLLGRIVDADSVFVNGKFVGNVTYQYPPRRYWLKPDVLKEGKNLITVKIINNGGRGGFVLDKPYALVIGKDSIDLKGEWKYKLGAKMNAMGGTTTIRFKPLGLYNAMIAPLTNYAIKGAIWYQGEANTKKPLEYFPLMQTLISDWRAKWAEGDFPFLLVQLANFMEEKSEPAESSWAELRYAQLQTSQLKNAGMAVAIDIGEWNDIHPLNKYDVGARLALLARRIAYHENDLLDSGPVYKSVKKSGNKLIISFTNDEGLTLADKKELNYFSVASSDKKFVWAKAKIENNKVVIWSDSIVNPVYVRYAWADNPKGANLCNKKLLPASPFEASVIK